MATSEDEIRRRAAAAVKFKEETIAGVARLRPDVFQQYVMRDEETGGPIELAPMHRAWHGLLSRHDRLIVLAHVEAGKSQAISIGRVLWEIGRNPNLRVCILSNTHGQAIKIIRSLSRSITSNARVHRVFPELKPDEPWTDTSITVKRAGVPKDPTVQAMGLHGSILGSRIDFLVVDDVLDWDACRTPESRQKTWDWIQSEVLGRLTERARVVFVGNAYHPDDVMHRFARLPGWVAVKYPVLDERGVPRWPERWSLERIEKKRLEVTPLEFARTMMCVARDDAEARFKQEWIDRALMRGADKEFAYALEEIPLGSRVYTGVDLAVQQHSAADYTVLFTAIFHPNGDREILDIQRGKWAGPEIVRRIVDTHRRYQGIVIVENNAAQEYLKQYTENAGVPVHGFTTGRNKAHPEYGVESLAAELNSGKWIFPNRGGVSRELGAFITELLHYDPSAHVGDCVMSCWFAREGARLADRAPIAEFGNLNFRVR